MREILFRGRLKDTTNYHYVGWVYGSLVYSPSEDHYYIIEHCDDELSYPVDKETIGQFTGISDKNGTKIFEGDILCMTFSNEFTNNKEVKIYNYVKYNDGMFATFYKDEYGEEIEDDRLCKALIEVDKFEVVGNIHDNHELLGDEND